MAGIVNKGGRITAVYSLSDIAASFGRERPFKVHVFGFDRAPRLTWVTAGTRRAHASIVLHVDRVDALEQLEKIGWRSPTVHARPLPHVCALYYQDEAPPAPEPEPEPEEQEKVSVRRVRRVRAVA